MFILEPVVLDMLIVIKVIHQPFVLLNQEVK